MAQVAVGRRERPVPELLLDHVDRQALGGELGGVGVAQAMGVHPLLDPCSACEPWQEVSDVALIDLPSVQGAEEQERDR